MPSARSIGSRVSHGVDGCSHVLHDVEAVEDDLVVASSKSASAELMNAGQMSMTTALIRSRSLSAEGAEVGNETG